MRLLNRKQAADRLGLSERMVYSLTRAGHLPAARVGRVYRYDPDALSEWMRDQTAAEREPAVLMAPSVNIADLDDRGIESRLLGALLAEQREVRRLLVRIGNRLAGRPR